MSLTEYKRKRNFRRTPEPAGNGAPTPGRSFVVQKHAASRLHYDFRLELDGVLKSWAVPKGPTLDPTVKSLAVHVEDHPLDYGSFEGVIPQGEYGGGTVMVWDRGTWTPAGDPAKQYRAGKLTFELRGEKLKGGWSLVRMGGRAGDGGKNWLLIKRNDKAARKGSRILATNSKSVLSDRSMEEIAADADRVWSSRRNGRAAKSKPKPSAAKKKSASRVKSETSRGIAQLPGAKHASFPKSLSPQLATLASEIPVGDDWLHELKFDGYRILAFVDGGKVRLVTRNGKDWTDRFTTVASAVQAVPVQSAILDGEIVSLDDEGRSNFQQLQNLLKRGNTDALVYYVFDLPYLNGFDLTGVPLVERKKVLATLIVPRSPNNRAVVRYSDHIRGQGDEVLAHACRLSMEGVVSKRADSKYQHLRSPAWIKVKCLQRQEFVIAGYSRPSGSRIGFGALLLGCYDDGELTYAGRVGTGFTRDSLRQLTAELKQRRIETKPFRKLPKGTDVRGVIWVRPELVGEVGFTEWTSEGLLRHPSFHGLREDKPTKQIVRERETSANKLERAAAMTKVASRNGRAMPTARRAATQKNDEATVAGVRITHPDRVLYADQGITKLELAKFYECIADWILPHVVGRPLSLVRCPAGQGGECFYQKHLSESSPGDFRSVAIQEKNKRTEYPMIDGLAGLISLVQIGVLEIHPWPTLARNVEKPDRLVMDLDPGPGVTWIAVIEAARALRDRFKAHKLQSFVRTSGGKGLHVVVPLKPGSGWVELKEFARSIANDMVAADPKRYVATMTKAKRSGKVFVDFFRNSRGSTAVASYSTRARAGAPVVMPLRWEELGKIKAANQFNVANTVRRLGALKADSWQGFFDVRQSL
jgi:bifunctional non-homologous end joining protein LigD